jgi:hypothetical protein
MRIGLQAAGGGRGLDTAFTAGEGGVAPEGASHPARAAPTKAAASAVASSSAVAAVAASPCAQHSTAPPHEVSSSSHAFTLGAASPRFELKGAAHALAQAQRALLQQLICGRDVIALARAQAVEAIIPREAKRLDLLRERRQMGSSAAGGARGTVVHARDGKGMRLRGGWKAG